MTDISVYFTYAKEDNIDFSPDRIDELYRDLLDVEPCIDKHAAIDALVCEIEQELKDEISDLLYDCADSESIEIDSGAIYDAVEDFVEEHWDETEHPMEDSEGQLHLFDPNEYNR